VTVLTPGGDAGGRPALWCGGIVKQGRQGEVVECDVDSLSW